MPSALSKPQVFERGDKFYLLSPIAPFKPEQAELEEYAFGKDLIKQAPNENLLWLRGNYVEADNANANGQMWTAGDIAVKKLTPMFMPVTVMHDPRTAVGLIADVALRTPEADKVPRSRIDTSLAVWAHRFPEIAEETDINYKAGTLMQSMECVSPHYTCAECGQLFHKLPDKAEAANWCEHLAKSDGWGARILGGVVFTGTGLIFGTRGARGANDQAHLEVFQDEVAEFHERAHRDSGTSRKQRKGLKNVDTVEISKNEYDRLQQSEAKLTEAQEQLAKLTTERDEAASAAEEAEAKATAAEEAKAAEEKKVKDFEEQAQKAEMAGERLSKLGSEFTESLGEFTGKRLKEQASDLSEEAWEARLQELEEMSKVKRDAKKDGEPSEAETSEQADLFTKEEVASSQVGSTTTPAATTTKSAQRSVMAGLMPSAAGSDK